MIPRPDKGFPGGDFADPLVGGEAGGYADHDGFTGTQVAELGAAVHVRDARYGLEEREDGRLEGRGVGIGGGWGVRGRAGAEGGTEVFFAGAGVAEL